MRKEITITEQIDEDYRSYALYVIQSRGIPNFYDSLTPVQRLILLNAPTNFKKTVGVVGEVFATGLYHHGDSSMSQAISKLARPFGCSDQILLGDGFFGTPVNPSPSAPRYTQVKISSKYKNLIEKYKDLNEKNEEGGNDWIHVDHPLGLSTHIVGIAVGYKSNILPRKPEDLDDYLEGNRKRVIKPYFKDFTGKVTKINGLRESSWLIEGDVKIDEEKKLIEINSLSPLQRYDSFYDRLNRILERSELNYKMDNFSTDNVKISIRFRCTRDQFKTVSEKIEKETKQVVSENIVFVKDGGVLSYETIEEYLDDFKIHRSMVILKRFQKDLYYLDKELEYLEAKLKFLIFMSEKKRTNPEVNQFLSGFPKDISRRLESISLTKLTKEEIISVKEEIKAIKADIKKKTSEVKAQERISKSLIKNAPKRKKKAGPSSLMESFEEYYNGIKIWEPTEEEFEEEQLNTEDE